MGRLALVTGGTRGIGAAISIALQAAGHKVIANYGSDEESARLFSEKTGVPTVKFDVGSFESVKKNVGNIEAEHGPVEILINNAGITRDAVLHRSTEEQWHDVIRTNLDSVFFLCRSVIEGMRVRNFGRIINISSINGQKGQMGQVNYSAAKAGLIGFTKALAQEGAAKGITVNAVAPGYIATEMVRAVPKEIIDTKIIPHIPIGRLGEPEEIARCVVFLTGDDAGFITGTTLTANGGQYIC